MFVVLSREKDKIIAQFPNRITFKGDVDLLPLIEGKGIELRGYGLLCPEWWDAIEETPIDTTNNQSE